MSLLGATILTGIATAVLAVGAIVTAVLAYLAFRKQAREVAAIERQVSDGQELARQQSELLKVQSGQMELQREQLAAQAAANDIQGAAYASLADAFARQAEVLELQAAELRESLAERKREAEQQRRAQAALVFLVQSHFRGRTADESILGSEPPGIRVEVVNSSNQPIYDVELRWHRGSAGWGEPNPEPIGVILPGAPTYSSRDFELGTNMDASGAVLRFRDASGIVWMRRPDGGLTEQQV